MKGLTLRTIYRVLLLILAIFIAEFLWVNLSYKTLTYISGLLGTFTLVIANFAWTFKDRVDQALNGELSNSAQFMKIRESAYSIIDRSNFETCYVLLGSFAAFTPVIYGQFKSSLYEWMVALAFIGAAEVIYSYLRMRSWLNQIISFRDNLLYEARQDIERAELIKRIDPPAQKKDTTSGKWTITG